MGEKWRAAFGEEVYSLDSRFELAIKPDI